MRAARDLILVICAVISTACLVWLVYLALNLDISVVDSIGGRENGTATANIRSSSRGARPRPSTRSGRSRSTTRRVFRWPTASIVLR